MVDLSQKELLAALVGYDTTSKNSNRPCIEYIQNYLDGYGVKSTLVPNGDGTKSCLFATLAEGLGEGIVLAGHTDCVPVDDQEWTSDPFLLTERNDRYVARGSCDMKGFIATVLSLVPALKTSGSKQPIHIAFTYDEETSMDGAIKLSDYMRTHLPPPRYVIVGEPTSLGMIDQHKGVAVYTGTVTGVSGHSGQPAKGINAIEGVHDLIGILRSIAREREEKPFLNSRFDPPYTTLNLGTIEGGTAENIIADKCKLLWQIRAHPGDSAESFFEETLKRAEPIDARYRAFSPKAGLAMCPCFDIPPLMPSAQNRAVSELSRWLDNKITGAVSFATEAGFYQALGTHVLVWGPGSIDQAHKADEYITIDQLTQCREILSHLLAS